MSTDHDHPHKQQPSTPTWAQFAVGFVLFALVTAGLATIFQHAAEGATRRAVSKIAAGTQQIVRNQAKTTREVTREVTKTLAEGLDTHARQSGIRSCAEITLLARALLKFRSLPVRQIRALRAVGCKVVLPLPDNGSSGSAQGSPGGSGQGSAQGPGQGPDPTPQGSGHPTPTHSPHPTHSPSAHPSSSPTLCVDNKVCISISPLPTISDQGTVALAGLMGGVVGLLLVGVQLRLTGTARRRGRQ